LYLQTGKAQLLRILNLFSVLIMLINFIVIKCYLDQE